MKSILVLNGPNLNLLGQRETHIYGEKSLEEISQILKEKGNEFGMEIRTAQHNSEGGLIDALHDAQGWADGVIINAGGYTHTSVSLRDAISSISIPVVEVHMSNVDARDEFRRYSMIAPVCVGKISGFGWRSYLLALYFFSSD